MNTLETVNESPTCAVNHEFGFTDADFDYLRKMVLTHTGISLSEHKRDLVYGRLSKRLRARALTCFSDYCRLLEQSPNTELEHFTNAITTNLTSFFRERHHFDFVKQEMPRILAQAIDHKRRIRIWSAGCSTGEEPYSLAITLREAIPDIDRHDIRILATDLDTHVVNTAARGIYPASAIVGLDSHMMRRWFLRGKGEQAGKVMVTPELRRLIHFKQLNLMHDWPMHGPFDAIFCRNVVIYFDTETRQTLFERFANIMPPGGYLFIGHAETLRNISSRFQLTGKTIYRRTG
jgi:chemotaxis protein methyltransferase CheR